MNPDTLKTYHENLSVTNTAPQAPFPYQSVYTESTNSSSPQFTKKPYVRVSPHPILHLSFSQDNSYLAVSDIGYGVSLVKRELITQIKYVPIKEANIRASITKPDDAVFSGNKQCFQWILIGRNQAHCRDIVSLMFVPQSTANTLVVEQHESDTLVVEQQESDKKEEEVVFPVEAANHCLISVGKDRNIAEYELNGATIATGFQLKVFKELLKNINY